MMTRVRPWAIPVALTALVVSVWGGLLAADVQRIRHADLLGAFDLTTVPDPAPEEIPAIPPLAPTPVPRVLVLGASSVAGTQLSDALDAALAARELRGTALSVGFAGFTSPALVRRSHEAVRAAETGGGSIDLVIAYYGHNDFASVYADRIDPRALLPNTLTMLWWTPGVRLGRWDPSSLPNPNLHDRVHAASFLTAVQRLGLVRWTEPGLDPTRRAVRQRLEATTGELVDLWRERGVPIVLVVPISNLDEPPHGVLDVTWEAWQRARRDEDPAGRMAALRAARDAERWSYFIRAKSEVADVFGAHAAADVLVVDTPRSLDAAGVFQGTALFTDMVHFRPEGRRQVAEAIAEAVASSPAHVGALTR